MMSILLKEKKRTKGGTSRESKHTVKMTNGQAAIWCNLSICHFAFLINGTKYLTLNHEIQKNLILNTLPHDKMLGLSKMKAFADKKINMIQKLKRLFHRIENWGEKEKMLVTGIFSFSHNVF